MPTCWRFSNAKDRGKPNRVNIAGPRQSQVRDQVIATSLIDSAIFRDIFGTEAMRRVWPDENRTQRCLDIEAALARAQASLGGIYGTRRVGETGALIPAAAATASPGVDPVGRISN